MRRSFHGLLLLICSEIKRNFVAQNHNASPTLYVCSFSTSANALKKEQRFLHRRLRGVHVPASTSMANTQDIDHGDEMESIDDFKLPSLGKRATTYSALLRGCGLRNEKISGMLIHGHIIRGALEQNLVLQNHLIQMYSQCGYIAEARLVFDSMVFRDEFSWNFIIRAFSQCGDSSETTQLFDIMLMEGVVPNKFIYSSVLLAYADADLCHQCRRLHVNILSHSLDSDMLIGNILVSMYCKCGDMNGGRGLFGSLNDRDVVSWNEMIASHTKRGQLSDAIYFSKQMEQEGVLPNKTTFVSLLDACASGSTINEGQQLHVSFTGTASETDLVLGTALLNMYGKCGKLDDAWRIFNQMSVRNIISWNVMITAYGLHGRTKQALGLFNQLLQESLMPDKFIFVSVLSAHAGKEDLVDGMRLYSRLLGSDLLSDPFVKTAALNMFCKCGSMEYAEEIFKDITEPDEVLWTAMISGYSQYGQGITALKLFDRMLSRGPRPTKITYMSILSACSRAGLVDEGLQYFQSMSRDHGIKPSVLHLNCVIDLLARSGRLNEAEKLITSMTSEATVVTWTILLDGCRKWSDVQRGERAADRIKELDPSSSSAYVMLSGIYYAAGRDENMDEAIYISR